MIGLNVSLVRACSHGRILLNENGSKIELYRKFREEVKKKTLSENDKPDPIRVYYTGGIGNLIDLISVHNGVGRIQRKLDKKIDIKEKVC